MFTDTDKKTLIEVLNQVLPPNADDLVSARVKLSTENSELNQNEKSALNFCLAQVNYTGKQDAVLVQMQMVSDLQRKLLGAKEKPTPRKKAAVH